MKIKFKNYKLITILIVIMLCLFTYSTQSFATDNVIIQSSYNNSFVEDHINASQSPFGAAEKIIDKYSVSNPEVFAFKTNDLPKYKLLLKIYKEDYESYYYYFIYTSSPLKFYSTGNSLSFITSETPWNYYMFRTDDAGFYTFTDNIQEATGSILDVATYHTLGYEYIACNYDIYSELNGGDLVFQQPTLGKVTTLAPVIQREKTKGTLQVVLKEIVEILPQTILVLVCFLGLRKALKMLFQLLRHS